MQKQEKSKKRRNHDSLFPCPIIQSPRFQGLLLFHPDKSDYDAMPSNDTITHFQKDQIYEVQKSQQKLTN